MKQFINYPKVKQLITRHELDSSSQKQNQVFCRAVIFNFLHRNGATLTKCGQMFPGKVNRTSKNHATVLNGLKRYEQMYKNPQWYDFNLIRIQLEEELKDCIDTTESGKFVNLTPLEKEILNCTTIEQLQELKSRIIQTV